MKIGTFKLALLISLALVATGCSCRTKKVGNENIDMAAEGDIIKDVHFAFDSYALDATAKTILGNGADWLKANGTKNVQIEGHCDERGTNEYNLALGERRAKAVMNYLVAQGIQASRLTIISYGEERPLCTDRTEACWGRNRRAHFLAKPQ